MPKSVDLDALRALLARGAEAPDLDYKSTWDPSTRSSLMELCKDVAAMESLPSGGYIVVGADDHGQASGTFVPSDRAEFDDQRIRSKIASVLDEPLDLTAALHEFEANLYLVLGIGTHSDGIRIMARDGQYDQRTVWREAVVFVRRGTSSTRWNQHEARALIERVIAARKEVWRADIFETVRVNSPAIDSTGYVNVNAEMPLSNFVGAVTELIRRRDEVGLDLLRRSVSANAGDVVTQAVSNAADPDARAFELGEQLDRLNIIAALSARYDLMTVFNDCVVDYQTTYDLMDEDRPYERPRRFAQVQLAVLLHAYYLGAALVAEKKWAYIALLSRMTPAASGNGYWRSLLRKAEVMTARSELGHDENGQQILLIERAKAGAASLLAELGDERLGNVTDLLAQFDVYRGVSASPDDTDRLGAYTNFAFYDSSRSEPAFENILDNPVVREQLSAGNDEVLRALFRRMSSAASDESFAYNGWDGFRSPNLITFVGE